MGRLASKPFRPSFTDPAFTSKRGRLNKKKQLAWGAIPFVLALEMVESATLA